MNGGAGLQAGSQPADLKVRPSLSATMMRRLLLLLLVLACVSAVPTVAPVGIRLGAIAQQAPASNWPQFRNTPGLTGVAGSALPASLRLQWTYQANGGVESSAAVVNGVAYVGTLGGQLVALDVASGKPRWTYEATGPDLGIGSSSPTVANGVVYVGDLIGILHAVDAATGKRRWTYKTGAEIKSSPVVSAGLVLIGSYDNSLYALNAATGALAWKFTSNGYVHATPAIVNGVAYFGGCDESFYGIRVKDGVRAAALNLEAYTAGSAAIDAGMAYFGTFSNDVVAVNLAGRQVKWRFADPDRQFPFYSSPAVGGGVVFIGGRDKLVHALDAATGKPRWSFTTRARIDSSPVLAGNRVVVGSSDGVLYVLDAATGKQAWQFEAGAAILASPAVADGRIIVGDTDGRVYGIGQ